MDKKLRVIYIQALRNNESISSLLRVRVRRNKADLKRASVKTTDGGITSYSAVIFLNKYLANKSIKNIYDQKDNLIKEANNCVDVFIGALKDFNIALPIGEVNKLTNIINENIDREWDNLSKFQLLKMRWNNKVKNIIYKFYAWRVSRKLNSYLEEPVMVKVKRKFKV